MSSPYYEDDAVMLYLGDCLDVMRTLPDASVDAVVTDPPYGLGFMGKGWDDLPPGLPWARECLRVLKPGGHLLAFGGTRTWHRLACAVEDAGFEVRDSIAWLYGSGFPKSLDVSKAIDRVRSEDRAPVDAVRSWLNARRVEAGFSHDAINKHFGHASNGGGSSSSWMTNPTSKALPTWGQWLDLKMLFGFGDDMDAEVWRLNGRKGMPGDNFASREVLSETHTEVKGGSWAGHLATGRYALGEKVIRETAPTTDDALTWQGWGTALKPAFEPIVVGRKPLAGTVAANVLRYGTGALNIAACRIEHASAADLATSKAKNPGRTDTVTSNTYGAGRPQQSVNDAGRWPTNVVLDDTQAAELDRQSGTSQSRIGNPRGDQGGASRFFPTFSHHECEVCGEDTTGWHRDARDEHALAHEGKPFPTFHYEAKAPTSERPRHGEIAHPTVKPLDLMRWLVRLVTPPGGTVLEPFAGSGTTAEACVIEGFKCIAIEREATYLPLIVGRLSKAIAVTLDFTDGASA